MEKEDENETDNETAGGSSDDFDNNALLWPIRWPYWFYSNDVSTTRKNVLADTGSAKGRNSGGDC
jgi:hypothetical protein